ncbi:MAG: hypothetical protein IT451_06950 [Candidatus Brocadia sp.]|nr:hypothetical protein [Candidatus Brocadia sp.]
MFTWLELLVWLYQKYHTILLSEKIAVCRRSSATRMHRLVSQWCTRWDSPSAHIDGRSDRLVHVAPLLEIFGERNGFISKDLLVEEAEKFRCHERTV